MTHPTSTPIDALMSDPDRPTRPSTREELRPMADEWVELKAQIKACLIRTWKGTPK